MLSLTPGLDDSSAGGWILATICLKAHERVLGFLAEASQPLNYLLF